MKPCEYTFKIVTDGPVAPESLTEIIEDIRGVKSVENTNFRVLPKAKAAKVTA